MADIQTVFTQAAGHIEMMTGRGRRLKEASFFQIFYHIVHPLALGFTQKCLKLFLILLLVHKYDCILILVSQLCHDTDCKITIFFRIYSQNASSY